MGLIRHLRVRRRLGAFADGELGATSARHVAVHVRECWTCGGELELLHLVRGALRQGRRSEPSPLQVRRLEHFVRELA